MSTNLPPESPENPTPPPPPPPPEPPSRGRLLRSSTDRMISGVAGGIGRYFGVDPVIVRIAIVVLTAFGGAGALLYVAAILLVPSDADVPGGADAAGPAPTPILGGERNRGLVILGVILAVVVAGPLLFAPAVVVGSIIVPLAFLVLLGLGVAWLVTGRRPDRDTGSIVRATLLGLGLVVLLLILFAAAFWTAGIGGDAVVAALVIAAGIAVLVGAFVRPARWLILPALAIAVPAAFVSAAGIDLDGGIGERTYRPANAAKVQRHYEIGTGRLEIDLRQADLSGERDIDIDVGMGEAVLIVPDDVCVATDARVGMGATSVFDRTNGGIDVDWSEDNAPRPGATRLNVDADIGLGHLDIRNTGADADYWDDEDNWDEGGWKRLQEVDRGRNAGCAA